MSVAFIVSFFLSFAAPTWGYGRDTASLRGTWRTLGVGLARVRCRAAKPAPSRRGRMRGKI
jgi:hypothetical protein